MEGFMPFPNDLPKSHRILYLNVSVFREQVNKITVVPFCLCRDLLNHNKKLVGFPCPFSKTSFLLLASLHEVLNRFCVEQELRLVLWYSVEAGNQTKREFSVLQAGCLIANKHLVSSCLQAKAAIPSGPPCPEAPC